MCQVSSGLHLKSLLPKPLCKPQVGHTAAGSMSICLGGLSCTGMCARHALHLTPTGKFQALHLLVLTSRAIPEGVSCSAKFLHLKSAVRANSDHLCSISSLIESPPRQYKLRQRSVFGLSINAPRKGFVANLQLGKDHCFPESVLRCVKLIVSATLSKDPSKLQRLALHCPRYIAASAEDHRYHLPSTLQVRNFSTSPPLPSDG